MKGKKYIILLFILAIVLIAIFFLFSPSEYTLFPKCPIYQFLGIHCAGCGTQRALHHLLHLEIGNMFRNNLFLPFWIFFTLDYLLKKIIWDQKPIIMYRWFPWVLLGTLLMYMLLRNIPYEPFIYLAPTL